MYIFSWKLRPTNIRCPNEVLGGSESCQTTCHEQAPGVFFDTSMICIFIEWSVMSLQGQRQNRSKGGFSRRKAWDTSENMWRTVVLFWFYGRTLQRTSFKWQVFPSKLLPSKPEVKEESKARENSHCCNHELQKPRCGWTVHRWSEKMSRWRRKSRNFLHKKSRLSGEENRKMVVEDVMFPLPPPYDIWIIWSGFQAKQIDRLQHLRLGEKLFHLSWLMLLMIFFLEKMQGWTGCSPCHTPRWCSEIFGLHNFAAKSRSWCEGTGQSRMLQNKTKDKLVILPQLMILSLTSGVCSPWNNSLLDVKRCGPIHGKVWERDSLIRAMQWLYCADSAADASSGFILAHGRQMKRMGL